MLAALGDDAPAKANIPTSREILCKIRISFSSSRVVCRNRITQSNEKLENHPDPLKLRRHSS